jgi:hypothetical protein
VAVGWWVAVGLCVLLLLLGALLGPLLGAWRRHTPWGSDIASKHRSIKAEAFKAGIQH